MEDHKRKRTALISGGSSGIGLAIAKRLAEEDIHITIADIQPPREKIPSGGGFIQCDVTNTLAIDQLYQQVAAQPGLPDILICNAGRGIHEKLTEGDPRKWQAVFEVNVMGALGCIRSFVPPMLEKGYGDVVFISSVSAHQPYPYGGIYAASKSALEVIAETLRLETMGQIRVIVLAPGTTDTGFFSNMLAGDRSLDEMGFKAISARQVADSLWFALNQSRALSINKITLRPTGQVF